MRTTVGRLGLTFVLVAVLVILLGILATHRAMADDHGDGDTISSAQTTHGTWGPGTLTATTDIDIQAGVIITVAPGTTIQVAATDGANVGVDAARIEFIVQNGAELRVNGPVTFTSQAATPSPADWYGVRFLDGSSGWVDNAVIEYGVHALTLDTTNPVTVNDSHLRYNLHQPAANTLAFGAGLYIVQGNHLIQNTRIYNNAAVASGSGQVRGGGIYIAAGAPHVLGSWIYENTASGNNAGAGGGIGMSGGGALIESSYVLTNTITGGGNNQLKSGGGIGFAGSTTAVISDTWIAANRNALTDGYAGGGGVGFGTNGTASSIERSVIYANHAQGPDWCEGAGIDTWDETNSVIVRNNLIISNTLGPGAGQYGGGANMNGSATGTRFVNNTIIGNQAAQGGGLFLQGGTVVALNNIIAYNSASNQGGGVRRAVGTVDYNDIFGNTAPAGANWSGTVGPNNISVDPLFVSAGDLAQWYHIRQGSPVIDAATDTGTGIPDDDFDHQPRPLGAGRDIGFDEVDPFTYSKSVDLDTARSGDALVYTFVITNPDPFATVIGGQINDAVPPNTTYSSGPDCDLGACGYDSGSNVITWTGDIPADAILTLDYTVTVDPGLSDGTEITNSADIAVGVLTDATNVVTTTVYNPAFILSKAVDGTPIAGTSFEYTILVTNTSTLADASGIVVTDAVPSGASYVSGGTESGGIVSWTIPSIAVSDSEQVTFTVNACQTVTNDRYRVADSDQSVSSSLGPQLVTSPADPTINVAFDYDPTEVAMGGTVDFTDTTTTNGGPIAAWAWDFGDGEVGSGTTTSHAYPDPGTYTATLLVTDTCGFTATLSAPVIVHAPVLTVTKSVTNPVQGAQITYTIAISNTDPVAPASGVVVTDALPSGANYISGGDSFDGSTIEWTGLSVGAGSSAQASFVVSTCQASLLNEWYRVVTSTQRVDSGWGASLQTDLSAPTINASFDNAPIGILINETVYFTDTTTTDGGPMVAWSWDFGDGDTGSGATTSHTYDAAGSYTVTLWVTDTCGFSANVVVPEAVIVAVADIDVNPTTLEAVLAPGGATTRDLTIANRGSADLDWSVAETPDVPWLTLAPSSGTTPPTSSDQVTAVFDATGLSDGVYNTTLAITSNDPNEAQVDVSVILTVTTPVYAVDLAVDDATLSGDAGQMVTYIITVTNMGNVEDSFATSLVGNAWPTSSSLTTVGPLAAGASAELEIYVTIPATALDGQTDEVVVMLTSTGDATKSDSVTLTTTVVWENKLYLPLVLKNH